MTASGHLRAAVLRQTGNPLTIEQLRAPELSTGQVLVEIAYSGVCRSQLMEVRGGRGVDKWLPHLLGHEATGRVLAVGDGVSKVAVGDIVVLSWIRGSGLDAASPRYRAEDGTFVNAGAVATFGTHAVIAENRVTRLPDRVPLDVGVLFGCALLTGAGMVLHELKPSAGSTVAIVGLGGVGLAALLASRLCACSAIIAVDVSQEKLGLAKAWGATHMINAHDEDPVAAIRRIVSGGVDYSVEAAGRIDTIEQAFDAVRPHGGRCVFASHPETGAKIRLDPHALISGKQIAGSWGGSANPDTDIPALASLYLQGSLPLESLISKRYPLEAVNQALGDLEAQNVCRPLLVMQ